MSSGNQTELARKEANLIAAIEKMLPDFARACRAPDTPVVIMHQDAFAAGAQRGTLQGHIRFGAGGDQLSGGERPLHYRT